ncbi:MAG TPA: hypothetical protein VLE96_07425 [Chlamydiales bacterium]|nr:hypothetical protein [Chlamydiales bacterium]
MSIVGYTRASAEKVWAAWSHAHQGKLVSGATGINQKIHYTILDVIPGRSFSVSWKALFIRLVFSHEVVKTGSGTEIRYDFKLSGPFAWMVRWWISPKIRANLHLVLNAFIKQIE